MVAAEGQYSFQVSVSGADPSAQILLCNAAGEVMARVRVRADGAEVNRGSGWGPLTPRSKEIPVTLIKAGALTPNARLSVPGADVELLCEPIVLGFEIGNPKTELRIKKLRLEPMKR